LVPDEAQTDCKPEQAEPAKQFRSARSPKRKPDEKENPWIFGTRNRVMKWMKKPDGKWSAKGSLVFFLGLGLLTWLMGLPIAILILPERSPTAPAAANLREAFEYLITPHPGQELPVATVPQVALFTLLIVFGLWGFIIGGLYAFVVLLMNKYVRPTFGMVMLALGNSFIDMLFLGRLTVRCLLFWWIGVPLGLVVSALVLIQSLTNTTPPDDNEDTE
jgi:hypothetical protein